MNEDDLNITLQVVQAPTLQLQLSGPPGPPGSSSPATTTSLGTVQLAGDLSGVATAPTVVSTHLASALPINQGGTGSGTQNFVDLTTNQMKSGTLTVPLIDKGGTVFSVRAYGAAGDGSTDDTVAITNTISAISAAGGGVVYFPAATYIATPFNVSSNVVLAGSGWGSVIKLKSSYNSSNNLVKFESVTNAGIQDITIDGNASGQGSGTQYGLYISTSSQCFAKNVWTKNCTGVGNHGYNNTNVTWERCYSTGNTYHGFECEQNTYCSYIDCRGSTNTLHGLLVSPGEVAGTGSRGNTFANCHFDSNSQYGIAFNAANGDVSAFLSEGNIFTNCTVSGNSQYGVNIYKQDKQIFSNLYVYNNGYFGIYCYQSAYNNWTNVFLHNNSQASNGSYDEIFLEGASSGHASADNKFSNIEIIIDASNKANYFIREGATGDSNTYIQVRTMGSPVTGSTSLSSNTAYGHVNLTNAQTVAGHKTFSSTVTGSQGVEVSPNATLASGMGLDAPFGTSALRFYNPNSGGNIQMVAPNGSANFYMGGSDVVDITSSGIQINNGYGLKLATSPSSGYVLTSDSSGNGTWQAVPTGVTKGFVIGMAAALG